MDSFSYLGHLVQLLQLLLMSALKMMPDGQFASCLVVPKTSYNFVNTSRLEHHCKIQCGQLIMCHGFAFTCRGSYTGTKNLDHFVYATIHKLRTPDPVKPRIPFSDPADTPVIPFVFQTPNPPRFSIYKPSSINTADLNVRMLAGCLGCPGPSGCWCTAPIASASGPCSS